VGRLAKRYIDSRWPMTLASLWHSLWTARLLLQTLLLAWMMARGCYRQFPFFVVYTGEAVGLTIVLKAMISSPSATGRDYFIAYTVGNVLAALLSFFVIHEIFQHALGDYPAVRKLGTGLFRGTTIFLLLAGVVMAWLRPAAELELLMSKLDQVKLTVSVMQCGLVIVLLLLARNIGLSLRGRTFGIAFGFGILASVDLAVFAFRPHVESMKATAITDLLNVITLAAALCSVAVWTAYFLWSETETDAPSRPLPDHDLESWNQELRRLLR
jgi:hypothetical protein